VVCFISHFSWDCLSSVHHAPCRQAFKFKGVLSTKDQRDDYKNVMRVVNIASKKTISRPGSRAEELPVGGADKPVGETLPVPAGDNAVNGLRQRK
jgi:hypothetical protein